MIHLQKSCSRHANPPHVVMVGLGYIGLPTASILSRCGYLVTGVDINPTLIKAIQSGQTDFTEPGLDALLTEQITSGAFSVSTTVVPADVFIIAVPTPVSEDKQADLSYVIAAVESLVPVLQPDNLIIIESTIPPGTTRHVIGGLLKDHGFVPGEDVLLTHCPERVLPGRMLDELIANHRVIGGINERSTQAAMQVYASFVTGALYPTSAETAEMVKLMENTYRDVNIALANEVAQLSEVVGVNAWEVVQLANQHPRVNLHQPGPGVGGHCISVDPWFLVSMFPAQTQLMYHARQINDQMPAYVVDRLLSLVSDIPRPKVTLLGITYKANVDDTREAPARHVYEALIAKPNLDVFVYDPLIQEHPELPLVASIEEALIDSDLLVLLVAHSAFKVLEPGYIKPLMRHARIYDAQHFWLSETWIAKGFAYQTLGIGNEMVVSTIHS